LPHRFATAPLPLVDAIADVVDLLGPILRVA
jgi:hypothetical protein